MKITSPLDILNGILAIVTFIIIFILGAKMILKYKKYKVKSLLFLGISFIGLSARNWPKILTFIMILTTENAISNQVYFILGYGHSIGLIFWMIGWISMTEFNKKTQNIILGAYFSFEIFYFFSFYIALFINPSIIGAYIPIFDEQIGPIIVFHNLVFIGLLAITMSKIFLDSRKTKNKEIRLKGLFLFIGVLFLFFFWFLDAYLKVELVLSLGLILSLFFFYIGQTLPKWIKKLLLKSEGK